MNEVFLAASRLGALATIGLAKPQLHEVKQQGRTRVSVNQHAEAGRPPTIDRRAGGQSFLGRR
jgi:hypothetical protein